MKRYKLRSWKSAAVVAVAVTAFAVWATSSLAASHAATVKVAIMTDCKGAFGFGYELDIGGAQAAFAQYAHGKPTNRAKPSAGMTNISVNGTPVQIVGYGCGNDTVPVAVTETKRLMEKLGADVMVGPLSGDEAVYVANYAKAHPTKTFIIGTAGSEDPTMQIHPANLFRYHGDGAQWNAGVGEIAYKKLGWRKAAIIVDDYSFGWTSGCGHDPRLLRGRRQHHQAGVPAAEHDGLRPVGSPAAAPDPGERLLLGGRRHRHLRDAEGVRAGSTASSIRSSGSATCSSASSAPTRPSRRSSSVRTSAARARARA